MDEYASEIKSVQLTDPSAKIKWARGRDLVGVHPPELLESPSSWLTRMALLQGAPLLEMASFLGLDINGDFDLEFVWISRSKLGARCGVDSRHFALMQTMFERLSRIDASGQRYLLSQDGRPQYRYCPDCMAEQLNDYFPIHWRFKAWRLCPIHNKLLYERCPYCDGLIVLPNDLVSGGSRRRGISEISRCFLCGRSLYRRRPALRFDIPRNRLTQAERWQCVNGRSLLAALYNGHFWIDDYVTARKLRGLNMLDEAGCFGHGVMHYENNMSSHVKYRHPVTHQIVHINKEPLGPPKEKLRKGGLFDG
jgi:hypothetical protein